MANPYSATINPRTGSIVWEHNYFSAEHTVVTFINEREDDHKEIEGLTYSHTNYAYPQWARQYIDSKGDEICINPQHSPFGNIVKS